MTSMAREPSDVTVGPLTVHVSARTATLSGVPVALSAAEFRLLRVLASAPARVFTREALMRDVFGWSARTSARRLDVCACRLRVKLGATGHRFVVNVWGIGYRLTDSPSPRDA